jgi:drug/metabolite transporter (DMT)-like permease
MGALEMQPHTEDRPVTALLADLLHDSTTLLRQEIALAKAEISQKVSRVGGAAVSMAIGGALGFAALLLLLACFVFLLMEFAGLPAWLATLIVGVLTAIIAFALIEKARSNLKIANLAPDRTVESLRRDAELLKVK